MFLSAWILAATVTNFPGSRRPDPDVILARDVLRIQNNTLAVYGSTDFDWVWDAHVVHGDRNAAANFVVIPLTQSAAYTVKYETELRTAHDLVSALNRIELAEELYPYWGHSWLSPSVVNFMTLTMDRLEQNAGTDPIFGRRIDNDWHRALEILKEEADGLLGQTLPFAPLDSSTTGDTKAEENAWASAALSAAVAFLPNDMNAEQWETTARALAYAAITRPSDPPFAPGGLKTITVSEDLCLNNHGYAQNAYYTAATIELLQQAALPYRVAGRDVPAEFSHNIDLLFAKYQTYLADDNGWPVWNVTCDDGDPTDLPFVIGDRSEYMYARLKADSDTLWRRAEPISTITEDDLWPAIQNHKVAWRYFVNVYMQHFPNRRTAERASRPQ